MTKTFKELLDAALVDAGKSKSDLGREFMGRKNNPFQGYYDLVNPEKRNVKITQDLLDRLCAYVGKPLGHFGDPDLTEARAEFIRAEYEKFLEHEVARETKAKDPEILEIIRQMPWNGEKLPTKAAFVAICIAMTNAKYTTAQIVAAARQAQAEADDPVPPPPPKAPPKKLPRKKPDNDSKK